MIAKRTHQGTTHRGTTHRGLSDRHSTRRLLVSAAAAGSLLLVTACGEDEPEVEAPNAQEQPAENAGDDAANDAEESTEEPAEETGDAGEDPEDDPVESEDNGAGAIPPDTGDDDNGGGEDEDDSDTGDGEDNDTDDGEDDGEDNGSDEPPEEGAGDPATEGLEQVQSYVESVEAGDYEGAYEMLSPEALVYFPDVSVFEENGVPDLADDLAGAPNEPQWAIRPAYEETHDSAQVVSLWGADGDNEPFAYAFAVRKLDGATWVIDQEITPSTGQDRLNWINPGSQEGLEEWMINPENPMLFALLKDSGPHTAVTASINESEGLPLNELPTDGAVMYELDAELNDGYSVIAASWVAEDDPFVHTSATPAGHPR